MIQREMYMKRIRPFIGTDLVKVMTGIRRCGKSVMLNLIQDELKASGVQDAQMISFNFEVMSNAHLCTAQALHDEVLKRAAAITGKVYLFFDEIQEVAQWEKAVNSFRIELDCDIHHRLQRQAAVRRTGDRAGRALCGIYHLPLLFCRISRTLPNS